VVKDTAEESIPPFGDRKEGIHPGSHAFFAFQFPGAPSLSLRSVSLLELLHPLQIKKEKTQINPTLKY
jgi:hypothetical protein